MRTLVLIGVLALVAGASAISFDDLVAAADNADHPPAAPVEAKHEETQDPEMDSWSTEHLLGFDADAPTHMFDDLAATTAPEPAKAAKVVKVVKAAPVVKKVAAPVVMQATVSSMDDLEAMADAEEHPVKKAAPKKAAPPAPKAKAVHMVVAKAKSPHMVDPNAMLAKAKLHKELVADGDSDAATDDDETSDSADAFANSFLTDEVSVPATPSPLEEAAAAPEEQAAAAPEPSLADDLAIATTSEDDDVLATVPEEEEHEDAPVHKSLDMEAQEEQEAPEEPEVAKAAPKAVKKKAVKKATVKAPEINQDALHPSVFAEDSEDSEEDTEEAAPAATEEDAETFSEASSKAKKDLLHPMAAPKKAAAPHKKPSQDLLHGSLLAEDSAEATDVAVHKAHKQTIKLARKAIASPQAKHTVKKAPKKAAMLSVSDVIEKDSTSNTDEEKLMDEPDTFEATETKVEDPHLKGLGGLAAKYLAEDDKVNVVANKAKLAAQKAADEAAAAKAAEKQRALVISGGHNIELDLSHDTALEEEAVVPDVDASMLGMGDDDDDDNF